MKQLLVFALILMSCNKQASDQLATKANKGKGHVAEATLDAPFTITNNHNGTFTVDYKGITNFDWMFFRGSDSLSTVSGNVYPAMTQSFWKNQVTIFTPWPSLSGYTYYQMVIVTWDGQVIYSNVVQ